MPDIRQAIVAVRIACVVLSTMALGTVCAALRAIGPWVRANLPGHSVLALSNPDHARETAYEWTPWMVVGVVGLAANFVAWRHARACARWLTRRTSL